MSRSMSHVSEGQPDLERKQRVRAAIEGSDLDLLICSLPINVLLLTGYWPVIGTCAALVARDGTITLFTPQDEEEFARSSSFADRIEVFNPCPLDQLTNSSLAIRKPLGKALESISGVRVSIGYEAHRVVEPASYVALHLYRTDLVQIAAAVIRRAELTNADEILAELRATLTPREISCMRQACNIAGIAYQHGAAGLRPGLSELAAAENFRARFSAEPPVPGARAGGFVYCMAGRNSAQAFRAYARSTGNKLRPRDLVLVHCNSYLDGFWTDITRTYCLGQPDARQQSMFSAVAEAREAALAAIRPGAKASEVDRAARRIIEEHGFAREFRHQTGHGVAYTAIDHAARPRLHPHSPDILSEGMAFNVEPAIYIDGVGGVRHCDVVLMTSSGAELLTDFQGSPELLQAA